MTIKPSNGRLRLSTTDKRTSTSPNCPNLKENNWSKTKNKKSKSSSKIKEWEETRAMWTIKTTTIRTQILEASSNNSMKDSRCHPQVQYPRLKKVLKSQMCSKMPDNTNNMAGKSRKALTAIKIVMISRNMKNTIIRDWLV